MKQRVLEELSRLEAEHNIRILLAVESGSRAWGFASPDSDYDVRFIYAHKRDWYLTVFEGRDVIEEMLPDKLDVSGWELRKTLRLFSKCNLALNEWLGSPIVYSSVEAFRRQLSDLVPAHFNPIAGLHHYRRTAENTLAEHWIDGRIGIKKLFYVLRPLYACRWIQHTSTQPPTEFDKLIVPAWVTGAEKEWIADLLEQKSKAMEAAPLLLDSTRIERLHAELENYRSFAESFAAPERPKVSGLDGLLRNWTA